MKLRNSLEDDIRKKQKNFEIYKINDGRKKILVIGNSHAFDFYFALSNIESYKSKYNFYYYDFDYLYCFRDKSLNDKIVNFINYKILNRLDSCKKVLKESDFNFINNLDYLILASRWPKNTNFNELINFFETKIKKIILIGNSQKFYDVPTLFFKKMEKVNFFAENKNQDINFIEEKILSAINNSNIVYFDKSKLNCHSSCVVFENNNLIYSDKDHWSYEGIKYFSDQLEKNNFEKYFHQN